MNPAAALFGGGSSAKKENAAPRQATGAGRGGTASPQRNLQRPVSPNGSARAVSPSPKPPQVSAGGASPSLTIQSPTMSSSSRLATQDLKSKRRTSANSETGQGAAETDPNEMREALSELKRLSDEVKGLQSAIIELRESHGALRGELRKNQTATSGSLPVDDRVRPGGKQAGRPDGKNLASLAGQEVNTKDLAILDVEGSQRRPHIGHQEPVLPHENAAISAAGGASEESDFMGGLWDACGFASSKKALPAPPARSSSAPGSRGNQLSRQFAEDAFPSGASASLASPQLADVGGSTSQRPAHHSAAFRGTSPHNRETPMQAHGDHASGTGRRASGAAGGVLQELPPQAPNFGTDVLHWDRHHQNGHSTPFSASGRQNELAAMGSDRAERTNSGDSEAPNFGTKAATSSKAGALRQPQLAPAVALDSSNLSSTQKATWRSPQVGERLILPFPDHEDEESGVSSSPGFATAASSPGWEAPGQHSMPSPVPPLNLPIAAYSGGRGARSEAAHGAAGGAFDHLSATQPH